MNPYRSPNPTLAQPARFPWAAMAIAAFGIALAWGMTACTPKEGAIAVATVDTAKSVCLELSQDPTVDALCATADEMLHAFEALTASGAIPRGAAAMQPPQFDAVVREKIMAKIKEQRAIAAANSHK